MPEVYFINVCFLPFYCDQLINSQKSRFRDWFKAANEDLAMFQGSVEI